MWYRMGGANEWFLGCDGSKNFEFYSHPPSQMVMLLEHADHDHVRAGDHGRDCCHEWDPRGDRA